MSINTVTGIKKNYYQKLNQVAVLNGLQINVGEFTTRNPFIEDVIVKILS